jgi:hypothetical protein
VGEEARKGRWLPLVYYYLATAVGLAILLFGLIGTLQGLLTAALPQVSSEARYAVLEAPKLEPRADQSSEPTEAERERAEKQAIERARLGGFERALRGVVNLVVGAPVFFWHLRQARRREPELLGAPDLPRTSQS